MDNNNNGGHRKAIIATISIIVIIVIGFLVWYWWDQTHYSIATGKVGIVVDQVGGIIRIQKGPLGFAEKSFWESVVYYDIMVRTEDMISPSDTLENGTTVVHPEPLENLRYGAIPVDSNDVTGIFVDVSVQWHIDAETDGWQDRIKSLYLNYPGHDYETKTVLPGVRDAVRSYANAFTTYELIYSKREEVASGVTQYVKEFINNITTLNNAIVIDKVFWRRAVPPLFVQEAYIKLLAAQKEAEVILTIANATREASIRVAEGQSIAIELVVNATSESVQKLISQGVNASDAVQYLGLQYIYDSLKKIADSHPDWHITLFIGTQPMQYVLPVEP